MTNKNRTSRTARFVARFVNGMHVVFDSVQYRNVATRGLAKDAIAEAAKRNASAPR